MKKLFAILVCVLLLTTLTTISATALKSPGGTVYHEVYLNRTHDGSSKEPSEKYVVKQNDYVELSNIDTNKLVFEGWEFYTEDMKPAVEGEDYEIGEITLADGSPAIKGTHYEIKNGKIVAKNDTALKIQIQPLVDTLYVTEIHKGVPVKFVISETETLSPVTADTVSVTIISALSVVTLAAAAAMIFTAKKAFSK